MPLVAKLLPVLVLAFASGCPKKRTIRSPDEPEVPRDGDQTALRRFEESQTRFFQEKTFSSQVTEEFESIAREYPDDPIVPHALLYAGMSATMSGDYKAAIENLDKLAGDPDADPALIKRGLLYRGIARNYTGDHKGALADLRVAADVVNSGNPAEEVEWLAAMAAALDNAGRIDEALGYYDRWYLAKASASERAYIEYRVKTAVEGLDEKQVAASYSKLGDKKGPAAAHLGLRLASTLSAGGRSEEAARVRQETAGARERIGLTIARPRSNRPGDPDRLGAIMPLTGKQNRLGDRTGRGLALAASFAEQAGSGAARGWPSRFSLLMRDSASSPARAVAGLDELDRQDVIGVVGPVDRRAAAEAADAADRAGVPLVTLSPRPGAATSPFVYHAVHSAEMRARALARYAINKGVKDFAIFAPKNGYGRAVGGAFEDEVTKLGGTVIVKASYAKANEANKAIADSKLKRPWKAIFIPDNANALALVAPALSAAFFQARPLGFEGNVRGRAVLMLSTAEALDESFLRQAGRHAWGAIFAPGFYADVRHPRIGRFVSRYTRAFHRPPLYVDAYAFDAALAIRAAVEAGATTRAEVAEKLAEIEVEGITGKLRFDASHRRADDGFLFEVKELNGSYIVEALQ